MQVEAEAEGSPVTEVQAEAEETAAEEPVREVFTGYSDSDYDVLLRIVQAEAGNCDMEGRVMVANVILNRVENDSFPNTITKVVLPETPVFTGVQRLHQEMQGHSRDGGGRRAGALR